MHGIKKTKETYGYLFVLENIQDQLVLCNMDDLIFLNDKSTTKTVLEETPIMDNSHNDKFKTKLFLQKNKDRIVENGLRTKGYFKKSYLDKPLISIITVTFNSEKYLEDTIKNITSQSYDNIEYIIIDGGSTDQTLDIINKYTDMIDYYVSEPDNGMYDALNKGFSVASGELINFCNSDDLFYSNNTIERIVKEYIDKKFDCCYGQADFIDENNKILYSHYPLNFKKRYIVTLGMPFVQPTFFWTKEMFKKVGLFNLNYKIASDYDLIGRILLQATKVINLSFPIVKFRKHGESFGDMNTEIAFKEIGEINNNFLNQLKMNPIIIKIVKKWDRLTQKINKMVKSR